MKSAIIHSRIGEYERKLNILTDKLSNYTSNETVNRYIDKGFTPSKTAQNSLNFLTREDENSLQKLYNVEQVQNLIKLIYILLNEPYEDFSSDSLITNLTTNIFQKYHVENFSKPSLTIREFVFTTSHESLFVF